MESDAAVFGLPSFPCRQRLLTRMRFSFHMMSAHRRAITSLARSAVAATVSTSVKYNVLVKDRRIINVSPGEERISSRLASEWQRWEKLERLEYYFTVFSEGQGRPNPPTTLGLGSVTWQRTTRSGIRPFH